MSWDELNGILANRGQSPISQDILNTEYNNNQELQKLISDITPDGVTIKTDDNDNIPAGQMPVDTPKEVRDARIDQKHSKALGMLNKRHK